MLRKPKFKPIITKVKLNPEQAVAICACYIGTFQVRNNGMFDVWPDAAGSGCWVDYPRVRFAGMRSMPFCTALFFAPGGSAATS